MAQFAEYYLNFLYELLNNIGEFFVLLFQPFKKAFYTDILDYFAALGKASRDFDVISYITFIVVMLINIAFVFFLTYRVVQLLRRFVIYRQKEVEKDELVEEMAKLKEKAEQLAYERNQILALRLGAKTGNGDYLSNTTAEPKVETKELVPANRFERLLQIDARYKDAPHYIEMTADDNLSLSGIVDRFVKFSASQLKLYYTDKTVRSFFAALATSKVIVLEGISGTGKTSLPYAMGKFFKNNTTMISIQPSWRDRQDLLGYLNEFAKKFNETEFLAALYEATYRDDINLVVLDEMNLARIEYYFAEFLSIMEMPDVSEWKVDLIPNTIEGDPKNIVDGKLTVPQNIWFVGTANQDDSTFTITDKVYDRAITLDLNSRANYFDAPLTDALNCSFDFLESLFYKAYEEYPVSEKAMANVKLLDEFIRENFKVTFGNRILRQFKMFIPVYVAAGGTEDEALDFLLMSKILRKFTSLNLAFLVKEINALIAMLDKLYGKGKFVQSQDYLKQLLKQI